jgi:F-box and leucine-rich repeat protein 14
VPTSAALPHCRSSTFIFGSRLNVSSIAHLSGLTALQDLDLSYCNRLNDSGIVHSAASTNCSTALSSCDDVIDSGIAHLSGLTALQHLDLSYCNYLNHSGIAHLSSLTALQHLKRWCIRMTDSGTAHLSSLIVLQHLSRCW